MKKVKSNKFFNFVVITASAVGVFVICAFAFFNYVANKQSFYNGTTINGINVGGMTVEQAANVVETGLNQDISQISITLMHKNKSWNFFGKDFERVDDISAVVSDAYNSISSNNILDRRLKLKQHIKNNKQINISYRHFLGGFSEVLNQVCNEIYTPIIQPQVMFDPTAKQVFTYENGQNEVAVDRELLEQKIDEAFLKSKKISVEIPVVITPTQNTPESLKQQTSLRAKFSTSYASSPKNRKSNVKTALGGFNGMVVMPDEEVSFNQTTGARTTQNGYKHANIILNGMYVEGAGGGVCQASTTLYNALLLANLQILEVKKHSMPASYVPLALDAMVSEGISDLKFKNNSGFPIYIKTWCTDKNANVEIYGMQHQNGEYYKTRSEFIKTIPHSGDRIVSDNGEYSNKVTFKGEYLRIKHPHEGYEANAYLQRFSADGELLEETLIRHEIYLAQEGIIIEGTEDVYDGITIPKNNVKFIPPQAESKTNKDNISNIISGSHNEKYNP